MIRSKFTEEQIETLKSAFKACDNDDSGLISMRELKVACVNSGYEISDGQLEFIFNTIDKDKSGEVDFDEFLNFIYICQFSQTEFQQAKLIFDGFDENGGGTIDRDELSGAFERLGVEISDEELEQAFCLFDKDNSGELDFNEYLQLFQMMKNSRK